MKPAVSRLALHYIPSTVVGRRGRRGVAAMATVLGSFALVAVSSSATASIPSRSASL